MKRSDLMSSQGGIGADLLELPHIVHRKEVGALAKICVRCAFSVLDPSQYHFPFVVSGSACGGRRREIAFFSPFCCECDDDDVMLPFSLFAG